MINLTRRNAFKDMFRAYQVFIDGVHVGNIKRKQTKSFPVEKGRHAIYVKIDWFRSNCLVVDVADDVVELEVMHNNESVRAFQKRIVSSAMNNRAGTYVFLPRVPTKEEEGWLFLRRK